MLALKIKKSSYLLLLLGFVVTMFVQLMVITPAQTAFALTPAEEKECYDKLRTYLEPTVAGGLGSTFAPMSKEKIAACVAAGICSVASEPVLKDGQFYRQYSCSQSGALAGATATALSAESAPLVKLYCGAKPTDRLAAVDYRDCSKLVSEAYSVCRISSFATGLRLLSPIESANCVRQQLRNSFPAKPTAQVQKAIEEGRVASAAVLAAAKDELACTDVGGVFDATKDPPCVDDPAAAATKDECPLPEETSMRWLGCSIMSVAQVATTKLYGAIQQFLYTPTAAIFDNEPLKEAAAGLRNLAIALILIAGLVMVIAQATGSDLVDAYTIRKLLPRIGVAIIGIALAWPLLRFAITLTNEVGLLADRLLAGVTAAGTGGSSNDLGTNILSTIFGVGAATSAVLFMGPMGVISLAGTLMLGLLLGLFVLATRQLVIMVCVVLAPLAIAAYVLPGTQKLWGFWKNTFITTLLMFPIIMFFLASGEAFAAILGGANTGTATLLSIIVFIAPYFLLPFAFKLAGGLMATIFSIANDREKGAFDRLRKGRQQAGAQHRERTVGRRMLQKRADYAGRLQNSASRAGRSGLGRRALNATAHGIGGYNIEAAMSGRREAVSKELNAQIATGADGEIRGLTVNKQHALRSGTEGEDWRVKDGKREFRTLGGAWVGESEVDRGHQRWGKDTFAQQTALSYEMRKANSEQDVRRISKGYKQLAQGPGGWGMSNYEAGGSWIGAAFENQNQHLEYKKTNWETGELGTGGYNGFVDELYEKKGSYPIGQMHSSTIERLQEAYKEADVAMAKPGTSAADIATLQDRKSKIQSIAGMFVHDIGAGSTGTTIPGADGAQPTVVEGDRPIAGATGERMVSSQGAAHVNERVFELAEMTGALDREPSRTYAGPDVHSQVSRVNPAASPYDTPAEKIANPIITPPNSQTQKRRP